MGAIGDAYATVEDLEERLNRQDESTNAGAFAALLDAASRAVESFTRRQFNKTTEATARRFRAVDRCRLPVDDFHTLTDLAVEVNGTALDVAEDIDARPWDGIVDGQPGWPYFDLFRVNGLWPLSRWPKITVTAQWGWDAVPEAIRQATLDVAVVMSFGGGTSGAVRSEAIDGYSVSYAVPQLGSVEQVPSELVKALPYRRKVFGVA